MAQVSCLDGSRLDVAPVPVVDRDSRTYEVTLRLVRDGVPFGTVGERCGFFLAALHGRLVRARADSGRGAGEWPDLDDRFPDPSLDAGLRVWLEEAGHAPEEAEPVLSGLSPYLPRDRELFAFRHRDPDDVGSAGELRCSLQAQATWVGEPPREQDPPRGRWRLSRRAILDAWGDEGAGVRAVLTSGELLSWLEAVLADCAALGASYAVDEDGAVLRRPAG